MRRDSKADVDDVPRWALWLVAVVCFGPLTLIWLLGALLAPLWAWMIAALLAEPERVAQDPSVTIWQVVAPGALLVGGFIGLIGLVRVLTLPRERPESHRFFTTGMVAVGLVTVAAFEGRIPDLSEVFSIGGLIYFVLPFTGAAWLLFRSWRFLIAASHR